MLRKTFPLSFRLFAFWGSAFLSAGLLELPFPIAGPMAPWRGIFAWFGLVPLLCALLSLAESADPRPLRRAFQLSYLCGVVWYTGNCYWIYDTMLLHGGLPPLVSALLMLGFSLVLGLYFGFFGLAVVMVRRASCSTRIALVAAPFLWTALDLAANRITSVPWDQLGYSQVDNHLVNQIAPWTGVYGIGFLLVAANALLAGVFLLARQRGSWLMIFVQMLVAGPAGVLVASSQPVAPGESRWRLKALLGGQVWAFFGICLIAFLSMGTAWAPPKPPATATAVLVQPNLDVGADNNWPGPEWNRHMAEFAHLAGEQCKTYIAGIPETGAGNGEIVCPPFPIHSELAVWPEAPAPFVEADPRFQQALATVARQIQAPLVVGSIGTDFQAAQQEWLDYNSALVVGADGARVGRYDKIHLVPFGEYIPFKKLIFFARKLTGRVSEFTRGADRKVFRINGHRYGIFICYESAFGDEVRQFAQLGAEVLVNVSDDGWYGDTSAPWQHLNMVRMRAIENRRWILRDTNNGVTSSIDPYGTVRQSIPRHVVDALPADYGFRDDVTFYTAHGDVFAWACALLSLGIVAWAGRKVLRQWIAVPER
jgi:apolipoprotein N-acyltransferase